MKRITRILFISAAMFLATNIFSQESRAEYVKGTKAVSGALGFFSSGLGTVSDSDNSAASTLSGLFGIGGDFEYFMDNEISVGAIARYYSTSDTVAKVDRTDKLMTMGAIARGYLIDTRRWSFAVSSGLGVTSASVKVASVNPESSMTFGLYWGMTVLYKLNATTRVGIENLRILGLGERLNGWVLSDYMAKIMMTF